MLLRTIQRVVTDFTAISKKPRWIFLAFLQRADHGHVLLLSKLNQFIGNNILSCNVRNVCKSAQIQ